MRFMFMIKSNSNMPPTAALMEAMHVMADREIKAGRMLDDGGLAPLAAGGQVRVAGGSMSYTDGPFVEAKEVVGGFAIFELPDMAAAIASAKAFMQLHQDHLPGWEGICEIRTIAGSSCRPV